MPKWIQGRLRRNDFVIEKIEQMKKRLDRYQYASFM